jgi:hypothetical protein
MDSEDIPGTIGGRLNLLSQCGDAHIYGACSGHRVVTPDFVQELIPRENRAAILNQVAKQSYLARFQFNWLSIPLDHRSPAINGDGVELIDLRVQDQYQFKEFVSLPKGTRLDVKITYDNSADNPRNPASPPKRVHWGEGSNDEIGSMSLLVVATNESELPELQQSYRRHVRSAFMTPGGLEFLRRRGR